MSKHFPIGIFDSGIGGLTVANSVSRLLPEEQIIYFGDTAHLPYGDKSADAISSYAVKIVEFLLSKNCKAIIVACNTASSLAIPALKEHYPDQLIINVIDPVVEAATRNKDLKHLGVIGTLGTISSGIYERKLKEKDPIAHR